jgi:hypothetical protein
VTSASLTSLILSEAGAGAYFLRILNFALLYRRD